MGNQISFADSSKIEWEPGARLEIQGELKIKGDSDKYLIRFGTNENALTADQLAQIRADNRSVFLDSQGYLQATARGTILFLK